MSNTHYSVWRDRDSTYGTISVSPKHARVDLFLFLETGEMHATTLDFEAWHDALREQDLLITPMIWRAGACVENRVADGSREIACVVPDPASTDPAPCNFSHADCSYWILYREGVAPRKLHFYKVLKRLIDVGTEVYVKLKSPAVQALALQVPRTERSREYLSGRLNVPTVENPVPGKIYVTCMQKPILARSDASDMACVTLVLDPWDVALDLKENEPVVRHLVSGPA